MRAVLGVCLCVAVMAVAVYAVPPDLGRDSWPLAGVTWMITRPQAGAPACAKGDTPTYIGPNTTLEIYEIENYGGYPEREVLVDEVEVPPTGYVKWSFPMRPGTSSWVRCRTRQWVITSFTEPDTINIYGCWSDPASVSVPKWATRWDTRDDVRELSR